MTRFCSKCGKPILRADAQFCPKCGAKVPATPSIEQKPVAQPAESPETGSFTGKLRTPQEWIAIFCGGAILILILVASPLLFFFLLLIFAAIVLYLWTRNNLSLVVKQKSIPADGTSTIPIRIQFANGFGQLKKQKFDREVTLAAMSGTIRSVVLPEGKAFVDTLLTASRECGNVRVAASYEGQKAQGTVEFRCDGGSLEITPAEVEIAADGKSTANLVIRMKDRSGNYLHFIDEKTVNLTTTLGTVSSPIRIPSRTQEIRATLVSGTVQGVAVVTATLDQMKGEASIRLKGRFCMHCGASMGTGAGKCPSCNKAPLSGGGVDTKTCPACGVILPVGALFCEWCGAKQAK